MIEFITSNWQWLIPAFLGLVEIVVRLTPTDKDDSILNKIKELFDFILPNIKKGGGVH